MSVTWTPAVSVYVPVRCAGCGNYCWPEPWSGMERHECPARMSDSGIFETRIFWCQDQTPAETV